VLNDALITIDNLKGHVINDVYVLVESVYQGFHEYKDSLKDQILLLLQLGDGDISRLTALHPSSHLQSLLMHMETFIQKFRVLYTKNGDKFGWVKYWRMTFDSPNSPKFSPTTIL